MKADVEEDLKDGLVFGSSLKQRGQKQQGAPNTEKLSGGERENERAAAGGEGDAAPEEGAEDLLSDLTDQDVKDLGNTTGNATSNVSQTLSLKT